MPGVDAGVSDRVPRQYRAGLLGLRNSTTFLGRATAPIAFAAAPAAAGYRSLMVLAAVGVLGLAIAAVVVARVIIVPGEPERRADSPRS